MPLSFVTIGILASCGTLAVALQGKPLAKEAKLVTLWTTVTLLLIHVTILIVGMFLAFFGRAEPHFVTHASLISGVLSVLVYALVKFNETRHTAILYPQLFW